MHRSDDYNKHRTWCVFHGMCNHKFAQCPYNKNRMVQTSFHAPCCGRVVRFLSENKVCKKCVHTKNRQFSQDVKRDRFEPQVFGASVKMDDLQLSRILGALEGVSSSLENVVVNVKTDLMALTKPLTDSAVQFLVKSMLCLSLVCRVRKDCLAVLLAVAQYLYSLNVGGDLISSFQEYATGLFSKITAQAFGLEQIFYIIAFVLSIILLGMKPCLISLAAFYRNMCSMPTFVNASASVFETIKQFFLMAISYVKTTFLGYSDQWESEKPYDTCVSWCDRVTILHEAQTKNQWNDDMLQELDMLHDQHRAILEMWRTAKPPVSVQGIVLSHASVLRRMLDEVAIQGVRQVPRVEPTFILLQGKTAVGKSMITPILAIDLIKMSVNNDVNKAWTSYVYNRNAETTFWDGYTGQKIIVYDDFGQLYDTTGQPNPELMEIIRLGNPAPYFPNMARLEFKGRTRIACEFVLMSANKVPSLASVQSMKEPEAVLRRINYLVEVDVSPEYSNAGRVDYMRVMENHFADKCGCSVDKSVDICLAHYRFNVKRWDGETWILSRGALKYNDMVSYIADAHLARMERSKNRIDYINKRMTANSGHCKDSELDLLERFQHGVMEQWGEDSWIDLLFEVQLMIYNQRSSIMELLECELFEKIGRKLYFFNYDTPSVYFGAQSGENDAEMGRCVEYFADTFDLYLDYSDVIDDFPRLMKGMIDNAQACPHLASEIIDWHCWFTSVLASEDFTKNGRTQYLFVALLKQYARCMKGKAKVEDLLRAMNIHRYHNSHLLVMLYERITSRMFEAQGGSEIVAAIRAGDHDTIFAMNKWFESLPCASDGPWSNAMAHIMDGTFPATFLDDISAEYKLPLPSVTVTSPLAAKFKAARDGVVEKLKELYGRPLFSLILCAGVATVATIFAYIFSPLSGSDNEEVESDLLRIRRVGNELKKSYSSNAAIQCDENDDELYVRIDKKKLCCETVTASGDVGGVKKARSKPAYSGYKSNVPIRGSTREFVPHSYDDPSLMDVEKIVLRNLVQIYSRRGGKVTFMGHGLMVRGRVMLTFNHLFALHHDELIFRRGVMEGEFTCKVGELKLNQLSNGDVLVDSVLVSLPKRYQLCRDITAHFAKHESITDNHFRTRLLSMKGNNDVFVRVAAGNARAVDQLESYELDSNGIVTEWFVRHHYRHDMDTVKGDCGAVLVQSNTSQRAKILGIHVAGAMIRGMDFPGLACAVTHEMLMEGLGAMDVRDKLNPCFEYGDIDEVKECPQLEQFDVFGFVAQGVSDNVRSQIRRSPLYGCMGEPLTKPALLYGSVDDEDVKLRAIRKSAPVSTVPLDEERLQRVKIELERVFSTLDRDKARVLTLSEAAYGVEGDEYIKALNLDSASGYPWVFDAKRKGKRTFIHDGIIEQKVIDACTRRVNRARNGERSTTIFSDHLKDERRPVKGFKFLKPRVFSSGPLDYTLVFRQYFGTFIANVMRHRVDNTVAVGINPHGFEWTHLAEHMLQVGDNVLAGDFSNYDGTLNAQMLWLLLDVVNEWYSDGNSDIREVLWVEIVNSVHMYRNIVYLLDHGNPSGNPMTTIVNSMYQYGMWLYVVQGLGCSVSDFVKKCRLVTYGDDNILSVRGAFLNAKDLIDGFAEVGMTLTSDVKDEEFKYKSLSGVTFLKRSFAYDTEVGRYLAPMNVDNIIEMIYWYRAPHQWSEVGLDIVETSVREMAHCSKSDFDNYVRTLRFSLAKRNMLMKPIESCAHYRELMISSDYLSFCDCVG